MLWRIVLYVLYIQWLAYSCCIPLPCYSQQNNSTLAVNCTAVVITENCSDVYLSQTYPDLYKQEYWPDKPYDVMLLPIQEGTPANDPSWLLPGFNVNITPPQSVSIQYVRGFQIDYIEDVSGIRKCVIMQISNTTLSSEHRKNNLKFIVKAYPLKGPLEYTFTIWSLPKPPSSESKTNRVRYGKTSTYGLMLNPDASADWVTTISYYNSSDDKYIRIWFVAAPDKYEFLEYNVALEKILSNEGQPTEHRTTVNKTTISQTEHIFWNVNPGRYRVLVQPYDNKSDTLDNCKCKRRGACSSCIRTKTSVIVIDDVPVDDTVGTTEQPKLSTTTLPDTSSNNLIINQQITSGGNPHVLPSILGFLAFLVVVFVIVLVIFNRRNKADKTTSTENANTNQLNHCVYPTSVTNQISTVSGDCDITKDTNHSKNGIALCTANQALENSSSFEQDDSSISSEDLYKEMQIINMNYENHVRVEQMYEQWFGYEHG